MEDLMKRSISAYPLPECISTGHRSPPVETTASDLPHADNIWHTNQYTCAYVTCYSSPAHAHSDSSKATLQLHEAWSLECPDWWHVKLWKHMEIEFEWPWVKITSMTFKWLLHSIIDKCLSWQRLAPMGNPWGCAGAAGISCKMKNHTSNICCLLKHLNVLDLKQELIASHLHCCVNYCHDMLLVLRHSSGTNGVLLCRCIALFLPNGWNKRTSIGIDQWAFTHNFANGSIKWEYIPVPVALSNDHC